MTALFFIFLTAEMFSEIHDTYIYMFTNVVNIFSLSFTLSRCLGALANHFIPYKRFRLVSFNRHLRFGTDLCKALTSWPFPHTRTQRPSYPETESLSKNEWLSKLNNCISHHTFVNTDVFVWLFSTRFMFPSRHYLSLAMPIHTGVVSFETETGLNHFQREANTANSLEREI